MVTTHFKILGFLVAGSGLRGGQTGSAQHRLRSDLGYFSFEYLSRDGVDGDVRFLAVSHIDDVGLIHLHFGRDDGHVRQGHQEAAVGILNAGNHVVADTFRQIADDAVDRRGVCGFVQNVLGMHEHRAALG